MTKALSFARPSFRAGSAALLAAMFLAGCQTTAGPDVTRLIEPSIIRTSEMTPPDNGDGLCWGQLPGPTETKVVQQTVLVEKAVLDADGTEISPAIYRNVTAPQTISTGQGHWFERVCDADLTADLVMSLQRALTARAYYGGAASGQLDAATRASVALYQQDQGLDSDLLSVSAAQQLGLIAVQLAPTEDEALGAAIDLEVEAVLEDSIEPSSETPPTSG